MNAGGVDKACKSNGRSNQLLASSFLLLYCIVMAFRFRKLNVYQNSLALHREVVRLTKKFPQEFDYLRKQMRRASLSVVLNIAEGSAKNSDKDYRRYLGNALGSVNELIAGGEVALLENLISTSEFQLLEKNAEYVTNQLDGFSKRLKQS